MEIVKKMCERRAQMTVELSIVFPTLIIIAIIVVNSLTFASECASFDRAARNTVRALAVSPRIRSSFEEIQSEIESSLKTSFSKQNEGVNVHSSAVRGNLQTYRCELTWRPTLFGLNIEGSIFGIFLPTLSHISELTINPYKPGDFV